LAAAGVAAFAVIFVVITAPVSAAVAAESFRNERLATLGFRVTRLVFVPRMRSCEFFVEPWLGSPFLVSAESRNIF